MVRKKSEFPSEESRNTALFMEITKITSLLALVATIISDEAKRLVEKAAKNKVQVAKLEIKLVKSTTTLK